MQKTQAMVGMLTGHTWERDGDTVELFVEPYNSVNAWWREHASDIESASDNQGGYQHITYRGQIGCDTAGLYLKQEQRRVSLNDIVGRILRVVVNGAPVYSSRRFK